MRLLLTRMPFLLAIQIAISLPAQTSGTIKAKVIDQSGRQIAGARVAAVPAAAKGIMGHVPECLTDDKGMCSQKLEFGRYHLTAQKLEDGYPSLLANFYGHGKWPATTEITARRPNARVTIKLGPKAATLEVHVIDDISGSLITPVRITLHPAADPHDIFSTSFAGSDPKILLPPDEDVLLTVSAEGYNPWHLEEHPELGLGRTVHIHSEEQREITIRLKHEQPN